MRDRFLNSVATLAITAAAVGAVAALLGTQTSAQDPTASATTLRTPWGEPDLQGIWTNATITPFERPRGLAGKEYFTEQEAAEYEKKVVADGNRDRRNSDATADLGGAYNEFWFDRGTRVVPTRRTSTPR